MKMEINLIITMSITNKYAYGNTSPMTPTFESKLTRPKENNQPLHALTDSNKQQNQQPSTLQQHMAQQPKYQFPYQFQPPAITNPNKKTPPPQPKAMKNQDTKNLQSAITNHANPIYNKMLFPILKTSLHNTRPNSEDNKYDYYQAMEKEAKAKESRKRPESQNKDSSRSRKEQEEEGEATNIEVTEEKLQKTGKSKSPYKASYNQYHKSSQPSLSSQSSTPPKASAEGANQPCEQNFLQKCLQHIMIQNSCLTKQVVLKEVELSQLRHELQKLRNKHTNFKKTKVDIQSFGNMEIIVSASEDDESERDPSSEQCSITGNGSARPRQEGDMSTSMERSQFEGSSRKGNDDKNLEEIQGLIQQIEKQQQRQAVKEQSKNMVVGQHKMEGLQFTRLDRLRMKKGLTSKRQAKQPT